MGHRVGVTYFLPQLLASPFPFPIHLEKGLTSRRAEGPPPQFDFPLELSHSSLIKVASPPPCACLSFLGEVSWEAIPFVSWRQTYWPLFSLTCLAASTSICLPPMFSLIDWRVPPFSPRFCVLPNAFGSWAVSPTLVLRPSAMIHWGSNLIFFPFPSPPMV